MPFKRVKVVKPTHNIDFANLKNRRFNFYYFEFANKFKISELNKIDKLINRKSVILSLHR